MTRSLIVCTVGSSERLLKKLLLLRCKVFPWPLFSRLLDVFDGSSLGNIGFGADGVKLGIAAGAVGLVSNLASIAGELFVDAALFGTLGSGAEVVGAEDGGILVGGSDGCGLAVNVAVAVAAGRLGG